MRRIYIIPKETKINEAVIAEAVANNCPEIVSGIPSALMGKVEGLPCVYEEPESPMPQKSAIELDIESLKFRVTELEAKAVAPK